MSSLIMCAGDLDDEPSRPPTLGSAIDHGLQLLCCEIYGCIYTKVWLPMGFFQPVTECGMNTKATSTLGDTGLL